LVGIPWRVAFALQADGWYLRSDIIWAKPNPMPESVTDRPTKAHEYLFLLTKSERYYYDAAAIAEPVSAAMLQQMEQGYDGLGLKDYKAAGVQNPSSVKARIIANAKQRLADQKVSSRPMSLHRDEKRASGLYGQEFGLSRNKRTVWTVNTMPYAGAHFATMPEKLVEPCILAGCPLGGLVLDPFVGSGTVVAVAERLGRRGVGVDLSYQDLSRKRTAQRGLRFQEPA
jgi:DNA modification methylase